jgi:hypothetical protein
MLAYGQEKIKRISRLVGVSYNPLNRLDFLVDKRILDTKLYCGAARDLPPKASIDSL